MNLSILQNFSPSNVRTEPFPYVVIENALPGGLYERLQAAYPSPDFIFANHARKRPEKNMLSNRRYDISAARVHAEPGLDLGLWRDFVLYHTSQDFLDELLEKLGDIFTLAHPDLIGRMREKAPDGRPRAGVRGFSDQASRCEIALDCQVGMNSPVTAEPSSVKSLHLDDSVELYAGLFYVRHPEDNSSGGDLEIYRWREGAPKRFGKRRMIRPEDAERVDVVSYRPNTFALLVNGIDAIHGVSTRAVTPHSRRLVNIIAEVYPTVGALFDERDHREAPGMLYRLKKFAGRLPVWPRL